MVIMYLNHVNELRTAMNFIDWTYISSKLTESNIKAIKRVEEVQNYKLLELMGTKLQYAREKLSFNFSPHELTQTVLSLLLKGLNFSLPPQKLKFENRLFPFELLCIEML